MERVDEALPRTSRRPLVVERAEPRESAPSRAQRGASTPDRLLIASSLLLVVSAAGLATGSQYELIFLGVFVLGLVLTLVARRMLAVDERARRDADR